jgi:hypothetical protein
MTTEQRPEAANDNAPRIAGEFKTLAERRAWLESLPSPPEPRKAKKTEKAKNGALSKKLRALLTWRKMATPADWTDIPVIDALDLDDGDDDGPRENPNVDCILEMRPSPAEIMAAIGDNVKFREVREARIDGSGKAFTVAVAGDISRYRAENQDGKKPDCLVRMGGLYFSNGASELKGKRIRLGGLLKAKRRMVDEEWRGPKGAANDNQPLTVGSSHRAKPAAVDFVDPIEERQEAARVRAAVGKDTAAILDAAIVAANFAEIGARLGYQGKHAERRGKAALLAACEILEKTLAA